MARLFTFVLYLLQGVETRSAWKLSRLHPHD